MTFYEWLETQKDNDTLAGAMARDVVAYKDHDVVRTLDKQEWLRYLADGDSCRTVLKAFEIVWGEFEVSKVRKTIEFLTDAVSDGNNDDIQNNIDTLDIVDNDSLECRNTSSNNENDPKHEEEIVVQGEDITADTDQNTEEPGEESTKNIGNSTSFIGSFFNIMLHPGLIKQKIFTQ